MSQEAMNQEAMNQEAGTTAASTQELINRLNADGIYLLVSEGKLKTKALPGTITAAHAELIKGNKDALIAFLSPHSNSSGPQLQVIDKSAGCELSYPQQRLWFLDRFEQGSHAYNMPMALKLNGSLDHAAVALAVSSIVARHESLRTCYRQVGEHVKQFICPAENVTVALTDISSHDAAQQEGLLQTLMRQEAELQFDLTHGPMIRASLIRCAAEQHVLLITMHHIASDGWSLALVTKEFCHFYNAQVTAAGAASVPDLPALSVQYGDYAHWQLATLDKPEVAEAVSRLKQQLLDAPLLHSLPTDKPRPSEMTYNGHFYRKQLSIELSEQLRQLAARMEVSLFALLETCFAVLLSRFSGADDLVIGTPTANRTLRELEPMIGFFVNTLVLRHKIEPEAKFADVLKASASNLLQAYSLQHVPFELLLNEINPERGMSYHPLFQTFIVFDNYQPALPQLHGLQVEEMEHYHQFAKFDLSLYIADDKGLRLGWEYNTDLYQGAFIASLAASFSSLLAAVVANPQTPVRSLCLLGQQQEQALIQGGSQQQAWALPGETLVSQFLQQAAQHGDAPALVFEQQTINYAQLQSQVARLSNWLRQQDVQAGDRVAIYLPRSSEMVVAMLAVMTVGAAYVPLDPEYPRQRLQYIVEDAKVAAILTDNAVDASHFPAKWRRLHVKQGLAASEDNDVSNDNMKDDSHALAPAYLIYTSGSTGVPKGVVVSHANVSNLLLGLDQRLLETGRTTPVTLLAVTSMSFDISVLELFWTLARGHQVVLADSQMQGGNEGGSGVAGSSSELPPRVAGAGLNFSLYYFATDPARSGGGKYDLLFEGAKFADQHGFEAVWMPERHFHEFGGQFPNPVVTAAALSQITQQLQLRAGSIVLPLHNPIQIAEDWAMLDNLSVGRAGVSITCGWHFNDFVFAPENYADRYEVMFSHLEVLRSLWRGDGHMSKAGNGSDWEVKIRPLPIQAEIPVWLTTAGNPETFRRAGRLGLHLLTHILGHSPQQLADNIALYRAARAEAGFDPAAGRVSVMIHTFVCADMDTAYDIAKQPFKEYLRSSAGLLRPFAEAQGLSTDVDPEVLLEAGCQRYFRTNALFGTVEHCARLAQSLYDAGVDEIACLIDFGVSNHLVLEHLSYLEQLHQLMKRQTAVKPARQSLAQLIQQHGVNMMQSTPSLMHLMLNEAGAASAIAQLDTLLLGGEYLSPAVLQALRPHFSGRLLNMYGPTETTVWSATALLANEDSYIGQPIANTQFYVLDAMLQLQPQGVIGELYIGGLGVTLGYHGQAGLTAERFIPDPFSPLPGQRLYRTGDLVRLRPDGYLDFYGRSDYQVKLRGFRIELGDIEKALLTDEQVSHVVVAVKQDQSQNDRLVAYVMAQVEVAQASSMSNERVSSWQLLYDETFAAPQEGAAGQAGVALSAQNDPRFNFASWVNSYTLQAYAQELMLEWIADTVARIGTQADDDVLEIGVGTGLVLFRIAPAVASYTGVDFAQKGLAYISANLGYLAERANSIWLHHCAAHEFAQQAKGQGPAQFDTIILNSIIQYFPSEAYLTQVIGDALAQLKPGGKIFIGDVRHLHLLETFASSVELARARPDDKIIQLRHRISQRVAYERELLLAPQYFAALPASFGQITRIEILPKPSQGHTEMSKYRYDVIVHTAPAQAAARELTLQWQQDVFNEAQIGELLQTQKPDICVLDGIEHPLLAQDLQLAHSLALRDPQQTLAQMLELQTAAPAATSAAATLAAIGQVAQAAGYELGLSWHQADLPQHISLVLRLAGQSELAFARQLVAAALPSEPVSNNPLKEDQSHDLIPRLQKNVRQLLPSFMQPDTYILMEKWPYTPNGKIDVQRLPVPEAQMQQQRGYVAPEHELEADLALLWAEVLNVERVGIHDNFFDLGGRSLLAAQLLNRITRHWGIELPVRVLFEYPTVAQLAGQIAQGGRIDNPNMLLARKQQKAIPATLLQQSLWYSSLHGQNDSLYNMSANLEIKGPLDAALLGQAMVQLQQRHELLNARFYTKDGGLYFDVDSTAATSLQLHSLLELDAAQQQSVIQARLQEFAAQPFSFSEGALIRIGLLQLAEQHFILMYAIHHIISDGWSNRLLIKELFDIYQALRSHKPSPLPPLAIQYADYALWMEQRYRQDGFASELAYWQQQLAGKPELLVLPWDKRRPEVLGAEGGEIFFQFAPELATQIRLRASQQGVTPYIFLLTCWQLYLSVWSQLRDISVGTAVQNRSHVELEGVVGYFVNTVVVRQQFDWQHSLEQIMAQAKALVVAAFDHQHVPFNLVVQQINPPRSSGHAPIYQVRFAYEVLGNTDLARGDLAIVPLKAESNAAKFDLALLMNETEQQFEASLGYNRQLFEEASIRRVCDEFTALVQALATQAASDSLQPLLTRHSESVRERAQQEVQEYRSDRASRLAARKRVVP